MPIEPKKTGDGAATRTNFRPPWVKEGPKPIPMPTAPWTLNKRGSIAKDNEGPPPDAPTGRKSSTIKIVPAQPAENGTTSNTKDPHVFERPKLREVSKTPPKEQKLQSREVKVPISMSSTRRDSKDLPQKVHIDTKKKDENPHKVELKPVVPKEESKKKEERLPKVDLKPVKVKETDKDGPLDKAVPSERNKIVRQESMKKVCPAPPPMPPMPPPPPPPQIPFERRESLTRSQLEKLESLRSRPRVRPDWGAMLKDIEVGKKLKKVQCNDRSQPLLPQTQAKGQFIYESEKANLHNQLLRQIQTGAALKHVKTNDRSKPILEGLRKFRRQMTIEEKIIKSMSMASMPPEEVEEEQDEMDDIDKVRDDLQSTKQMLALELRNKEAQIAENKRLLARLANLEAELEKFKNDTPTPHNQKEATPTPISSSPGVAGDDKLVKTLKNEAEEARKTAEQMEKKYHQTADELFTVKNDLDEVKKQNALLERKLQQAAQGGPGSKRMSFSDRRESVKQDEDEFSEEVMSESEDDEGEDNEEKQKRRAEREVRLIRNKLKSIKNKEEAAKRERKNLRDMMKKNQQAMKEEKKKYKKLQKEVNKMAALMKDDDEDEDEEKEDIDEEEEEETESEESETESESESSEEESESESEDEDAPIEDKKENINARIKQHENSLNVVKKGNYMLKANVDRLQDDLNKQKEMVVSLQEDLDSVLAELG